ncbi:MAG: prepilin-type N-terminal cleavage/methylation domain-containing protein [Wenzhouxiangella sp.]
MADGFTLIELLVVVTIGAVLAGMVVLTVGRWSAPDEPERQLARVAALLEAQCEQALFQSRARGLRVTAAGFDFWQAGSAGWVALPSAGINRHRAWRGEVEPDLFLEGRRQALDESLEAPQILCQPLGEVTPFELELRAGQQRTRLTVAGNGRAQLRTG